MGHSSSNWFLSQPSPHTHLQIQSTLKSILSIEHIQKSELKAIQKELYKVMSKGTLLNKCVTHGNTFFLKSFLGSPRHSQESPESLDGIQDFSGWEPFFCPQLHLCSLYILWPHKIQPYWIPVASSVCHSLSCVQASAQPGTLTHPPCPFFLPNNSG